MDIAEELAEHMTCPRCRELSDEIEPSVFFEGKCCPACDIEEQQRHLDRGCAVSSCPCQLAKRPTERGNP